MSFSTGHSFHGCGPGFGGCSPLGKHSIQRLFQIHWIQRMHEQLQQWDKSRRLIARCVQYLTLQRTYYQNPRHQRSNTEERSRSKKCKLLSYIMWPLMAEKTLNRRYWCAFRRRPPEMLWQRHSTAEQWPQSSEGPIVPKELVPLVVH